MENPNSKDSFNYKSISKQLVRNADDSKLITKQTSNIPDDSTADNGIFSSLSLEVILNILRFLDLQSLGRTARVSRSFKDWVDNDYLWLLLLKIFSPAFNKRVLNKYKTKYPEECLDVPFLKQPQENIIGKIGNVITRTPLKKLEDLSANDSSKELEKFLKSDPNFSFTLPADKTSLISETCLKILNYAANNKDPQVFPQIFKYFNEHIFSIKSHDQYKKLLLLANNRWILLKCIQQMVSLKIYLINLDFNGVAHPNEEHIIFKAIESRNFSLVNFLITFIPIV